MNNKYEKKLVAALQHLEVVKYRLESTGDDWSEALKTLDKLQHEVIHFLTIDGLHVEL